MSDTRPFIRMRGRSIMALVLTPEPPLASWLGALDAQIQHAPNFFDNRPVVIDLGTLPRELPDPPALMRAIEARGIHIIGTEGAHPSWSGLEAWGRPLPGAGKGRPIDPPPPASPPVPPAAVPVPPATTSPPSAARASGEPASLLIDRSVRSGQSIACEHGDLTILGSVASGAEIVAGGSIHVYGTLRGRAIAGTAGRGGARIFCSKLHAELLAIDGVYQTAEDMPRERIGAASCAWLDGDTMRITAID